MRRLLGFVLSAVLLGFGLNLRAQAQERQPEPLRKRGAATAEETRPAHFPHRIWAACDFRGANARLCLVRTNADQEHSELSR